MLSAMWRLIVRFLAIIGAASILAGIGVVFVKKGNSKIESVVLSPDSAHSATRYTIKSRGIKDWTSMCYQKISVNSSVEPFSLVDERKSSNHEVFQSNCVTKVTMQWLSDKKLLIDFSGTESGDMNIFAKNADKTGEIQIKYNYVPNKNY